jgi:hypothetical protein
LNSEAALYFILSHRAGRAHFFYEFGNFGSVDRHEQQVDDGSYVTVDDHTIRHREERYVRP